MKNFNVLFVFALITASALYSDDLVDEFRDGPLLGQPQVDAQQVLLIKRGEAIETIEACPGNYVRNLVTGKFSGKVARGKWEFACSLTVEEKLGSSFGPSQMIRIFVADLKDSAPSVARINIKQNGRIGVFSGATEIDVRNDIRKPYYARSNVPVVIRLLVDFDAKCYYIKFDGNPVIGPDGSQRLNFYSPGVKTLGGLEIATRDCGEYLKISYQDISINKY